jgi:RNA polymerase subunit RPABC4/transcription elongation factor Spt4
MALIKCAECGKEVSDQAFVCPNCGNPINSAQRSGSMIIKAQKPAKKTSGCLKLIGIISIAFLAAIIIAAYKGSSSRSGGTGTTAPRAAQTQAAPAIDVTATALVKAYESNEISADAQYKGKNVNIKGRVEDISTSFTGLPRVTLRGTGMLQNVYADFKRNQMEEAGRLSKGQTITVKCQVTGYTLGNVVVDDCVFPGSGDAAPSAQPTTQNKGGESTLHKIIGGAGE